MSVILYLETIQPFSFNEGVEGLNTGIIIPIYTTFHVTMLGETTKKKARTGLSHPSLYTAPKSAMFSRRNNIIWTF